MYDDIIKGKGEGLVFLLHGTPGLGKTLGRYVLFSPEDVSFKETMNTDMNSSESVAESARRPLYQVTIGELSTTLKS